jgi:hypothetical protein
VLRGQRIAPGIVFYGYFNDSMATAQHRQGRHTANIAEISG